MKKLKVFHQVNKPTKNNEINGDSDSDEGINVIFPFVEVQRKIKAESYITEHHKLLANREWQNTRKEAHFIKEKISPTKMFRQLHRTMQG